MATYTAVVRPDGTIIVPIDEASPGETVIVRVDPPVRSPAAADPGRGDEPLTMLTADTPEKRERLIQETLEMGRRIRAQLSEADLAFDHDAWLYDESGLPH